MSPPPSQGIAGQLMLGIMEELDWIGHDEERRAHGFIEAVKRANTLRDTIVTEYERMPRDRPGS